MSLQTVLDQLEGRQVLIIGDVILDEYIWGDVNRISPEAPVPVLEIASETIRTGGAANVAQNIVNLGGRVDLIGVVGNDDNGKKLITPSATSLGRWTLYYMTSLTRRASLQATVLKCFRSKLHTHAERSKLR